MFANAFKYDSAHSERRQKKHTIDVQVQEPEYLLLAAYMRRLS